MSINPIKHLMQDIGSITPDEIEYQRAIGTLEQWCKNLRNDMNDNLIHFPIKRGDWIPCDREMPPISMFAKSDYYGDLPDTVMDISEPVMVTFLDFHHHNPTTGVQTAVFADNGDWYWYDYDSMEEIKVEVTAWKPLDSPYRGYAI